MVLEIHRLYTSIYMCGIDCSQQYVFSYHVFLWRSHGNTITRIPPGSPPVNDMNTYFEVNLFTKQAQSEWSARIFCLSAARYSPREDVGSSCAVGLCVLCVCVSVFVCYLCASFSYPCFLLVGVPAPVGPMSMFYKYMLNVE